MGPRDDFPDKIRHAVALRAGYQCSFPGCTQLTVGPSDESSVAVSRIGVAAHIRAAAPGGKRYLPSMTPEQRKSIDNAIWMCATHGTLIDQDDVAYPVELLVEWKRAHESRIKSLVEGAAPVAPSANSDVPALDPWQIGVDGNLLVMETFDGRSSSLDVNENGPRVVETLLRLLQRIGAVHDEYAATRWKTFLAGADLPLVVRWTSIAESLMRAGKARILAAMWNEAVTSGQVPYLAQLDTTALSGPPDPRALLQIRSEKMASWAFLEQQPLTRVGGRVLARLANFGWKAGAWDPSHRLAAPLFELMWDALSSATADHDRSGPAELHLWSAAGGALSVGSDAPIFFPWPTADLPTFADYHTLANLWNAALAEVSKFRRHFPRDSRVADDLAYCYVECHHALWHPDSARAEWTVDISPRDWLATLSHLLDSAKRSRLGSPAYGEWTRSLPLLAAPESGLSEHIATAILEATKPDEPSRAELRELRRRRARICLSRQDVDGALAAIDRASPGHSWSSLVGEPG